MSDDTARGYSDARPDEGRAIVDRAAGPWTPTIHRLLEHLAAAGLEGVPRPIEVHDGGRRERVTLVRGMVPSYPLPATIWSEGILADAARFARRLHDATADFARMPDERWRQASVEPAEVVCHGDLAPYNMVIDAGELVGVIDFDTALRGPRVWDLAYLAYRLVPLTRPESPIDPGFPMGQRCDRLRMLASAYGDAASVAAIVGMVPERLLSLAEITDERARTDVAVRGHAAEYRADARWVQRNAVHLAP